MLAKDDSGAIFIDRSPKYFDKILNLMRDSDVNFPSSQQEIQEILREIHAYNLDGLVELCEKKLQIRFIDNNAQMIDIIRNCEKPVFIIYYKLDNWNKVFGRPMAGDVNAENVLEQYKKFFDIYFKMSSDTTIVKLNIGGTLFQTTKSTLTKFDGMFKVMMETEIPVAKDESGAIFIDRSAKHFDTILNFMRDCHVELPQSSKKVREIQKEAHFYLLEGLVELCKASIPEEPKIAEKKLKTIESDSELLQIITNPSRAIIVFHCPSNAFGAIKFPAGFNAEEFQEKYKDQLDIYYKPYKSESPAKVLEWQWTIYEGKFAVESSVHDPRMSFEEYLDDEIKYCLMEY